MSATGNVTNISAPLLWQAEPWTRVSQQIVEGRLPHALLLTGPEDIGKSRFALALARRLLCRQPAEGLNCGHCHACELSGSGSHGDFLWLEPEEKSRVIKIDAIRRLVDFTNRTAGFGTFKVAVLSPAENMNTNAANALLKSLEEPSSGTYLILVSHRPHGLPATIRSRCQLLRLGLPDATQAITWLRQRGVEPGRCEQLLQLAAGRPLLAERLQQEAGMPRLAAIREALQELLSGSSEHAEKLLARSLDDEPVEHALRHLEDGLQAALRQLDGGALASPTGRAGFRLLDELLRIRRAVQGGSNPNRQVLLDALLAQIQGELGGGGLGAKILSERGGDVP